MEGGKSGSMSDGDAVTQADPVSVRLIIVAGIDQGTEVGVRAEVVGIDQLRWAFGEDQGVSLFNRIKPYDPIPVCRSAPIPIAAAAVPCACSAVGVCNREKE